MVRVFCQAIHERILFDRRIIPGMCRYLMKECLEFSDLFHALRVEEKTV